MDANRWARLEELFAGAADLAPDARARFIAEQCGDDAALAGELRALLDADRTPHPIDTWGSPLPHDPLVGKRIGPYQIDALIGRGGMGDVYRARRSEPDLTVAIKRVRAGFVTGEILQRFAAERQILAQLAHPDIARLLDGGTDDTGCPYVVMEFVDGEPMDAYLRRANLTIDQRLRLFARICEAVHSAHQNLVVHRDLEPGNILITTTGDPKLVDFGLAKILGGVGGSDVTRDLRVFTPSYASPEQVAGRPTGTFADVYALGVILYEILTGRRPFDLEGRSALEVESIVSTREPERPSASARRPAGLPRETELSAPLSPVALSRALEGDLDAIVLKAMAKDPARRYASARELAADVTRHLDRQPISARPDSVAYRVNRFVRRHARGVALAAVVIAALVTTTAVAIGRARAANREAIKAGRISDFMQRVFLQGGGYYGRHSMTVAESLALASEAARRELQDEVEAQVAVERAIGLTFAQLGETERARQLMATTLALSESKLGATHGETVATRAAHALVSADTSNPAAERQLADAIELTEQYPGSDREVPVFLRTVLTRVLIDRAKYDEADRLSRETLALLESTAAPNPLHVSTVYNNLGVTAYNRGRLQEAADWYARALQAARGLPNRNPYSATAQNLGVVYRLLGRLDEASALLEEAVNLRAADSGPDHPLTAISRVHLGETHLRQGRIEEARESITAAYRAQRAALPDGHLDLARGTTAMGALLCRTDRASEAIPLFEEALRIRRTHLGTEHWLVASVESQYGDCLVRHGQTERGLPLLTHSAEALERALGRDHPTAIEARERLLKAGK